MSTPRRPRNSPSDSPERRRARRKKHYDQTQKVNEGRVYCSLCHGTIRRGGLSETLGFHRKCDPAQYQRELRSRDNTTPPKPHP